MPAIKARNKKLPKVKSKVKPVRETKETIKLENNEKDTSPPFNMEAWLSLGVPPLVVKALEDQKFETPTAIQSLTLAPAIMGRRDILGAAETGSGKTLAFGIPIIAGILEAKLLEAVNPSKRRKKVTAGDKKGKMMGGWLVETHDGWLVESDSRGVSENSEFDEEDETSSDEEDEDFSGKFYCPINYFLFCVLKLYNLFKNKYLIFLWF